MSVAKSGKKAVNLPITADMLLAARSNDINRSATLEAAVADQWKRLRGRQ
jgi:post-segregation antitoxin (ccd killing protein)